MPRKKINKKRFNETRKQKENRIRKENKRIIKVHKKNKKNKSKEKSQFEKEHGSYRFIGSTNHMKQDRPQSENFKYNLLSKYLA